MTKKGIIFDMDGTLWDSAEGVAKSWTEIVQKEAYPDRVITVEQIHSVMGKTMDKIAEILFADMEEKERMELLTECCEAENDFLRIHGGTLYPELENTLKELQKKYHLYIVSNCQSGYIEAFLEHYGFGHYFEDIECFGNNGFSKGKNIANVVERNGLTDSVYVGDIQGDYDASMEAGVKFILAAYGFGSVNADVPCISSFEELPKVVENLLK